ncbi:hypothetical protein ABZP36_019288, partial [Zizania latifolia]
CVAKLLKLVHNSRGYLSDIQERVYDSLMQLCNIDVVPYTLTLGYSYYTVLLLAVLLGGAAVPLSAPLVATVTGDQGTYATAAGNATSRLDRRSKMFLHTARASGGAAMEMETAGLGLFDAFFASLSMIIVSEIGDETFIIAALMAMRHPKSTVLSGALSALVVMTDEAQEGLDRSYKKNQGYPPARQKSTRAFSDGFTDVALNTSRTVDVIYAYDGGEQRRLLVQDQVNNHGNPYHISIDRAYAESGQSAPLCEVLEGLNDLQSRHRLITIIPEIQNGCVHM